MEVPNRLQLADAAIRLSRLEGEIRERAWRYALSRLTPDERIKVIEEENEAALRASAIEPSATEGSAET